jgi:cytochrome b561
MTTTHPSTLTLLVLAPLVVWRLVARFKKLVGRQRLSKYRAPVTLAIYSLLSLAVGYASLAHPGRVGWLIASLLAGGALAVFVGIRHTRLEATTNGLFYTPHAHLGMALYVLFVARIVYRVAEVYWLAPSLPRDTTEFMGSPATVGAFGLLAGYFLGYAVGLARWRASVFRAKRLREAGAAIAAASTSTASAVKQEAPTPEETSP